MCALRTSSRIPSSAMTLTDIVVRGSSRVVSTTPRKGQNAVTLTFDDAVAAKACPFRPGNLEEPANSVDCANVESPHIQEFSAVPGPRGLPFIGTLYTYIKKGGLSFSKMFEVQKKRSEEYGPIYKEQLGNFTTVVVSSPQEYLKLVRAEGKFPERKPMEPIAHYRSERGMGPGIVSAQGEEWHKQRTVVSKKMLRLSEVSQFAPEMALVADQMTQRFHDVRNANGEVPALEKELFKWAMESAGTLLFEERIGCLEDNPNPLSLSFIENLEGFFKTLQPLIYHLPIYKLFRTKMYRKFEHHSDKIFEIGQTLVEKKMSEMETNSDSKSAFLKYLTDHGNMDTKEVASLAIEMLTGAVETVTTTTTWCLYTLAQNPRAQQKMYEEICEAKVKVGGTLSAEDIAKLPYVKAVVKETLRQYPITYATSRFTPTDLELAGYHVPAGSHVQANLYGMYRNADLYYQPEEFLPERWLKSNNMDPVIKSLSHLVWGHGARMCIGRRIAEQEMHLALTKLVECFKMSYHHDPVEPVLNTVMTPDRPVRICFTPRNQ